MLLKSIEEKEFQNKVDIRFSNISEGFNKFHNGVLEKKILLNREESEERIFRFFERILELNGEENSFIDFYYLRLREEDKQRLKEMVSADDRITLNDVESELKGDGIYFRLSKEILPFIVRLCTREVLFSTFYFTKIPCTIWGNYNMEFPCFFKDEKCMEFYDEVSNNYDLKII